MICVCVSHFCYNILRINESELWNYRGLKYGKFWNRLTRYVLVHLTNYQVGLCFDYFIFHWCLQVFLYLLFDKNWSFERLLWFALVIGTLEFFFCTSCFWLELEFRTMFFAQCLPNYIKRVTCILYLRSLSFCICKEP